jgi:Ser/Thr protein kinase RdoA (MazF antagonist)
VAGGNGRGAFDETLHAMYTRVGLDDLPRHLAEVHGIEVAGVTRLDVGVLRVDRRDGPPWVARVFSSRRPMAAVEGDAAALRHVERHGFPAERLAAEHPLSVLHDQPVLVTEFIASASRATAGRAAGGWGGVLARMHALPLPDGAADRPAGALHHFAEGTRDAELRVAGRWLDQIESRVARAGRGPLDRLRAALDEADGGAGLPSAFIHPDPVHKNFVGTTDGPLAVDWTGAGVGPRVVALEHVLTAPTTVARVAANYRSHIELTGDEWERLPGIGWSRRLVNITFRLCLRPEAAPKLTAQISAARRQARTLVAAARAATAADAI